MPDRPSLTAENRDLFGNRLGRLRRSGIIPANLVVPGSDSVPLQLDEHEMATHLRNLGRGGLVELQMSEKSEVALLQDVDIHPVSLRLQHVVFRHVDLAQSIEVPVGVQFMGEAPADSISGVFVVYELDIVRVRCLPDDIPHTVTVDVSGLESPGDAVRIGDLESIDGVEYVDDMEAPLAVVHIERLEEEEEEIEGGLLEMVSDAEGEEEESGDTPSEDADDA